MALTVLILDNQENFLSFLDTDLLSIEETEEEKGLTTASLTYSITDVDRIKEWFKLGNKVWVQGDVNLKDCLYIINTKVKRDYFKENSVTCDVEEVLVELNNAPLISQNQINESNGFTITSSNGEENVTVNYSALNYWFGKYFTIGVLQETLHSSLSKIVITGTMTRMELIRHIENETGNIFRTRYEKDINTNLIHRYLDFLNPENMNRRWSFRYDYEFPVPEESNEEPPSSYQEQYPDDLQNVTAGTFEYSDDEDEEYDEEDLLNDGQVVPSIYKPTLTPENTLLRLLDVNTQEVITVETEGGHQQTLCWKGDHELGFTNVNVDKATFSLSFEYAENTDDMCTLQLYCNKYTYTVYENVNAQEVEDDVEQISNVGEAEGVSYVPLDLPDTFIFDIYDTDKNYSVFQTIINPLIGKVHTDVLDLSHNVDNIEYEVNEEKTFNAVAPVFNFSNDSNYTRENIATIVRNWTNLAVNKGDKIPMIVQKSSTHSGAAYNVSSNYYVTAIKTNGDNVEYWIGTAYWYAPFTKYAGDMYIQDDTVQGIDYPVIRGKREYEELNVRVFPKIDTINTTEENKYAIYNAVAMHLKDCRTPEINVSVDVANINNGNFNDYNIHDKVYIKVPGFDHLIRATVNKTVKNPHDVGENTVELTNYVVNNKSIPTETTISGNDLSFKYPNKGKLTAKLLDVDNNPVAGKLISFNLYNVENGSSTNTGKTYTKKTNNQGQITLSLAYKPGDYELVANFGGDENYESSTCTFSINVYGTVEKQKKTTTKATSKSAKKKSSKTVLKYKKIKKYYSKYGVSPDKKTIMAIGLPSAGNEVSKYGYKYYKTVFKNYCPHCKKSGVLVWGIWWAGKHTDKGYFKGTGGREGSSVEGAVFCTNCDADYSIFGREHESNPKHLTVVKKPKKSSEREAYSLRNGHMLYSLQKILIKQKSKSSGLYKYANLVGNVYKQKTSNEIIDLAVRKQAFTIAGNKTGIVAAKRIAKWVAKNIDGSDYKGFKHSPAWVLKHRRGNDCDQTRLMLQMWDAVGVMEKYRVRYMHVSKGKREHVFAYIRNTMVDPCKIYAPWGHYVTGFGKPWSRKSPYYPHLPF